VKKQRVLTLVHKHLVPPADTAGIDVVTAPWKMEFDVIETLREIGHEVLPLGVHDDLGVIRAAIDEWKPTIVFNLLESFDDVTTFDMNVVSYLELLKVRYTGCNPRGLLLARDKALSKQLLAFHRVPVPDFTVFRPGRGGVTLRRKLQFPVIVKSLTYEASVGISQASVVSDEEHLRRRVEFIHTSIGTDAIVERYIEGRELYVGLVGNERVRVFPVWEMHFQKMIESGNWPIATERVKWSTKYQERHGIKTDLAQQLPEGAGDQIQRIAKRVYRTLGLTGYARVDLRMDQAGRIYVIEANPNPQLAYGEDFAESAERAGLTYEALLDRIMGLGLSWRPGTM
jgi:D-alanine-D-alanine ligase